MSLKIESDKIFISTLFQQHVNNLLVDNSLKSIEKELLVEYIADDARDYFWDSLYEFYPEGELLTKISLEAAEKAFIAKTQENIEANREAFNITISLLDDSKNVIESLLISGADILLSFLEDESSSGEFYAKIGGYIEKSMELFVDSSVWHFGYINKDGIIIELRTATEYEGNFENERPILWFGPKDVLPEKIWTIKYDEPLAEEWFYDDQWALIDYLIDDCNDSFSIWYIAECGRWLPDMCEILQTCPIKFEEDETTETVRCKFEHFFNR